MKTLFSLLTLCAPVVTAHARQAPAQQPPVLTPRITELGSYQDSTINRTMLPQYAALSPRGNLVVYSTNHDLRLWNPGSRSSTVLLPGWTNSMAWSPAGDALVFSRNDDQGSQLLVWSLRLDPVTGKPVGEARRVSLTPTTGYTPQFSPDGKLIAFSRSDGGGQRSSLTVVPAQGGTERMLASGYAVRQIRWSGDGSAIYYVVNPDSTRLKRVVSRVSLTGGMPQLVYDATAASDAPLITQDARLAFWAPPTVERHARTLTDLSGKPLRLLTSPPDTYIPDWSGAYRVVAVRDRNPRALRITNLADGTSRELLDQKFEAGPPAWFPDGRRLASLVRNDGVPALVIINPDGTGLRKIPLVVNPYFERFLLGFNHADLQISPDGRYAAYIGGDRESLELVDLSSGSQRTLARSTRGPVTSPKFRSDSRSIRYIRDGATGNHLATRAVHEVTLDGADKMLRLLPRSEFPGWATPLLDENTVAAFGESPSLTLVPLDGRPPRVILSASTHGGGQFSPDGRTLAVRLGGGDWRNPKVAPRVTLVSLADLSRREVELPFASVPFVAMHYSPDGRHLFIAGRDTPEQPISIYKVPLDGSAPRVVAKADTKLESIFAVSPDAKFVAYTVAAWSHATFLMLDYSAGVAGIPASSGKP